MRLTRRFEEDGVKAVWCRKINDTFLEGEKGYEEADKLASYEDAEEQGLLVRLPFAIGDIVYWIADAIYPFEIKDVRIDKFGINVRFAYRGTEENKRYWEIVNAIDVIGEKVFLTRTEAEAALAEMEK